MPLHCSSSNIDGIRLSGGCHPYLTQAYPNCVGPAKLSAFWQARRLKTPVLGILGYKTVSTPPVSSLAPSPKATITEREALRWIQKYIGRRVPSVCDCGDKLLSFSPASEAIRPKLPCKCEAHNATKVSFRLMQLLFTVGARARVLFLWHSIW